MNSININQNEESCVVINPSSAPTHTIIWLHGLGADGHDFAPIVPELGLPDALAIRFIFPHAPIMPVTINQGYEMRAWFDIYGVALDAQIDRAGIANSVKAISQLIQEQVEEGIAVDNIILGGFSQGAVIALNTGLTYPDKLGGIIALSGYLPDATQILRAASKANRKIPIFIAHGTLDPLVPFALGDATQQRLSEAGYPVSWHAYPMPHSVCPQEISDIGKWIKKIT